MRKGISKVSGGSSWIFEFRFSKVWGRVAGIFEGVCGVLGISYSLRLTGYREQSIMAVIAKSMK